MNYDKDDMRTNLYEQIGLPLFSTASSAKARVADLSDKGLLESAMAIAESVLCHPESKQRYDMLLTSILSNDKSLPLFADPHEEQEMLKLSRQLGIDLQKQHNGCYRVAVPEETEPQSLPSQARLKRIAVGSCEVDFELKPFSVLERFLNEPTIIKFDDGTTVSVDERGLGLPLEESDRGLLLMVLCPRARCYGESAGCVNQSQDMANRLPYALNKCFRRPIVEIAETFGVRAKRNRVQVLIDDFQNAVADFAEETSLEFECFNRERLISFGRFFTK